MRQKQEAIYPDTSWFDNQLVIARTSLRAIARRGRCSASTLSRIIRGQIPLNMAAAIVLADAFGVSIEEIVKRCGFQPPARKDVKSRKKIIAAAISRTQIARRRASKTGGPDTSM